MDLPGQDSDRRSSPPWPRSRPASSASLRALLRLLSLPLLAFLTLPLLALFVRVAPAHLLGNLANPQVLQALALSLTTTLVSTLATVLFGTPVAYALARRSVPFVSAIHTLIDLPTVLPPAVAGLALLMAFGRRGLLGGFLEIIGLQVAFTTLAVILAQMFVATPFYIKAAILGFTAIDTELEQSAQLDGASSWQVFRFILVPLAWTALVSGAAMTWARALGEFGATIIFAGNFPGRTQTMPLAIYIGFQFDLEAALTLSVILVIFSFLALLLVRSLLRREESAAW